MTSTDTAAAGKASLENRKLELTFAQTWPSIGAHVSLCVICCWALLGQVGSVVLFAWAAAVFGLCGLRLALLANYRNAVGSERSVAPHRQGLIVLVAVIGAVWGACALLFLPQVEGAYQFLIIFVLAGLSAGGVTTLAPILTAYVVFLAPMVASMVYFFIAQAVPLGTLMSLMTVVFGVVLVSTARTYHNTIGRTVALGFEKDRLVEELSETNSQLRGEIGERERATQALQESERRFREFAEIAADWFYELDADLRFTYLSDRHQESTGWQTSEVLGRTFRELYSGTDEDPAKLDRHMRDLEARRPYAVDLVSAVAGGEVRIFRYDGRPVFDANGEFQGYRGTGRDVTKERQRSQQLSYAASHDALTDLLNRDAFEQRLSEAATIARDEGAEHVLCFMDLDRFKAINDSCGHAAGDELLRQLARLLQDQVRRSDTLARVGGDEFGVLLDQCSVTKGREVAESLRKAVEAYRFTWEGRTFTVGASIGLAPITPSSGDWPEVMQAADRACYISKESGRNRVHVYDPDDVNFERRDGKTDWVLRIERALEDGRMALFAQPILPLSGGDRRLPGLSIRVRMRSRKGKEISPAVFMPAVARHGLAPTLDKWVLEHVLDWLEITGETLADIAFCSVRLADQSLGDSAFRHSVVSACRERSGPAGKLCLAVSEPAALANLSLLAEYMSALRPYGCRFGVGGFGGGGSSFAYLNNLPVDILEIDDMLVRDIHTDPTSRVLIGAMVEIGRVMDRTIIAPGVEDEATRRLLDELGVHYARGSLAGREQPLSEGAARGIAGASC